MKRWVFLVLILILALSAAGCSKTKVQVPEREVPISQEAADRLQQKLTHLDISSGRATITVTESELTSYINLELLDEDVPIEHPTIWFDKGKVYIKGKLRKDILPVSGEIALVARVAVQDGKLHLDIQKAVVGGLPVPGKILEKLTELIDQYATTQVGPWTIVQLSVDDGKATITVSR